MGILGGIRSMARLAGHVAERAAEKRRQRRTMNELARLSPETLKDIGLGDYRQSTDNFI